MSEHAGFIRGFDSLLVSAGPVDTGLVRDAVVNNVDHLIDESTQLRVHWVRSSEQDPLIPASSSTAYSLAAIFGPFPVALMPDGQAARIVVRLAGRVSAVGTATWRIAFLPFGPASAAPPATTVSDSVAEVDTSSTSVAWLDPTPQVLTLERELVDVCRRTIPSNVNAMTPGNAEWTLMQCEVWAKVSSAGRDAELHGLYVREYVGV